MKPEIELSIVIPTLNEEQTGGFDESCHLLAETRFADRLRRKGEWILLGQR